LTRNYTADSNQCVHDDLSVRTVCVFACFGCLYMCVFHSVCELLADAIVDEMSTSVRGVRATGDINRLFNDTEVCCVCVCVPVLLQIREEKTNPQC
jgi:hypothetical protein